MNVTDPVGVPEPGATTLTLAVNVIGAPKRVELGLELTLVVVVA